MKKIALLFSVAMLFTLGNAPMDRSNTDVTLNASQVTSAVDIEHAINTATNNGTRPGIVTLDSSKGDFTYSADDRSINVYYSNIIFRSKNGAVITNCGDGIYFDNTVTNNIVIEGIVFYCNGTGVNAWGAGTHKNVTVRDNVFKTGGFAIEAQYADGWNITDNRAVSDGYSIHLLDTTEARIADNFLVIRSQGLGIFLEKSNANSVKENMIVNVWQGVLIGQGSSGNHIANNRVYLVQQSGISFEGGNEYNSVLVNKINCQSDGECRIVNVDNPPLSPTNKIEGNKFVR